MNLKYYILSICLMSVFHHAVAQELLTAQQAVELVLNNNYAIQIAKNNLTIADKNNTVGNAGMLPTVNATLGDNYTLTNINQQFANGQEINRDNIGGNNLNAAVNLNWTIFDGLRMFATKSKLKKLEDMGELQFKEEVQQTVAQTLLVYYDVVKASQQLKAISKTISIAEERVKLADAKFQVGTAGKNDLLQAKVDLNAQKSILANQLKVIEQRKADLNALLARSVETEFKTEENIPINLSLKVATEAIDTKNFQVLMAIKNAEVAQQNKREAVSQYLPNLRTNLGYSYGRSQSDAGFSLFNQTYGLNAGFTLTVPLFNGLNTIREVKVATLQLANSRFQIEQAKVQQRLALLRAVKDWTTTKELLLMEEENILLAEENVKITLERFRLGQSISIELREAQKSFEDANARLANIRYAAKVAETELLRLQGELVR